MKNYYLEIIRVSFPFMISTFFDATSFTLMVFIVSFFLQSPSQIAALGSSIYLVWVLWGLATSISSGITSLTSRFLGDNNKQKINYLFTLSLKFSFVIYLLIVVLFNFFLVNVVFSFLHLSTDVTSLAKNIVMYYCYIIIFSIVSAIVFSILQGIQKTKEIMYITVLAVLVEVLTVFLGIKKINLDILINLAWLNGELVRIFLGYYFLKKEGIFLSLDMLINFGKNLYDELKLFIEAFSIGFPLKLGMLIFGSVYYFIISFVSEIGSNLGLAQEAVSALTLSQRLEVFVWMIDAGLSVATTTIIGKIIGYESAIKNIKNKSSEVYSVIYQSFFLGTLLFIPIFIVFTFFNSQLLSLFIKNFDIINIGKGYLFYTGIMGLSMVFNAILTGFFIAIGKTTLVTIFMISYSLLRIPLCNLATNFDHIWISINFTNVLMAISLFIAFYLQMNSYKRL